MSVKPIREFDAKRMMQAHLWDEPLESRVARVHFGDDFAAILEANPWLATEKLVVKPDQLIKRRGKAGLLLLNTDWAAACAWIEERMDKPQEVDGLTDNLTNFIVEPFLPHGAEAELYVCIQSTRAGDEILFFEEGGVEVGDVDAKGRRTVVALNPDGDPAAFDKEAVLAQIVTDLLSVDGVSEERRPVIADFLVRLLAFFRKFHYAYLEINPTVIVQSKITPLDVAAKVDQTADYECKELWGALTFPGPFGHKAEKEEAYIASLDAKTGSSLKLTILNREGRVWTMVAGGGASVVYSDTICDLGFTKELANYGEYSGAPSEDLTCEYAKTVLGLVTASVHPEGKVVIIGGGIANFTNVAATFKGIIKALEIYRQKLIDGNVKIWVRRAGPNYQEGLKRMNEAGIRLGLHVKCFGPETHITSVVPMALGLNPVQVDPTLNRTMSTVGDEPTEAEKALGMGGANPIIDVSALAELASPEAVATEEAAIVASKPLFTKETRCIVYGLQARAVQGMLDFDHICGRTTPSVAAVIYPFGGDHYQKFYFGNNEILMPIMKSPTEALAKFPEVDVVVNFSSFRSVLASTMDVMTMPQVKVVAIIAEGVPEHYTKQIIAHAKLKGVIIIGPATVGGIKPGCFRIGNTGGMLDNIVSSRLYRAGSVAYVSRSGGMSNELNNIVSRNSDGVYEGVAIGGDRYPGTGFMDHIMRFQADPGAKVIVLLGEVGGTEEYAVIEAIKKGELTKPVVAWCIGTCSGMFGYEVQFGHAGSMANAASEKAEVKNAALKEAGCHVPSSFDDIGELLRTVYMGLVQDGTILCKEEPAVPKIPVDYKWARELGLVRKPAAFVSTICDDRGEELLYAGVPISKVFEDDIGLGGVLSLLWFKRRLPPYAAKFIEMVLMITADHGPAVSGAHNTIVSARAGKDLVSALCSGLLTIGPRFGGAVDGAAQLFAKGSDHGMSGKAFVADMRKKNILIQGIGHRVKSASNPDMRVKIIKEFVLANFPTHATLDFALSVEEVTLQKKENLILNVDGCIGACFVDLLRHCGAFSPEEAEEYIEMGCLNGLFVLGRTVGFIGHYLDQKRLKEGLYRHPWDDIAYIMPELAGDEARYQ